MAADDVRITSWDLRATAGVTESLTFVAPTALESLSVYVGGTVTDVDDLTDATEYAGTLSTTDVADDTATVAVDVPTGSVVPLRLVVDGAVETVGRLTPSTTGTTNTDDTIELSTAERTYELTVIGQRGPQGEQGETGPAGPQGDPGPAGASGSDATVDATNVEAAGALMRTGGTMTGDIVLSGDATADLHPVTKQQLDGATSALVLNVATYGATGDGSTDDTTAVQAAIDDAAAAGGGIVWFPVGDYRTDQLTLGSFVSLVGESRSQSILRRNFTTTDSAYVVLADANVSGTLVENLTIHGSSSGPVTPSASHGVLYANAGGTVTERHRMHRVTVKNCKNSGVYLDAGGDSFRADHVFVQNCSGHGFYILGTDCFFTSCTAYQMNDAAHGFYVDAENNHFVGCYAYFCGSEGTSTDGFHVNKPNNQLAGCFGQDNGRAGLYLTGAADRCVVSGFAGDSNGQAGIVLDGSSDTLSGVAVSGAVCHTRIASPRYTQDYGIQLSGTVTGCSINGTCRDNGTADLSGLGAGNNIDVSTADSTGGPLTRRIYKTADETVTGTVAVQSDDELTIALGPNQKWVGEFTLYVESTAAADFKIGMSIPAGASIKFDALAARGSDNLAEWENWSTGAGTNVLISDGTDTVRITFAVATGATAGSVTLQWAQGVSTGDNTTVKAGSHLVAHRAG